MEARYYLLYRREPREIGLGETEIVMEKVWIYDKFGPKQLRRMLAAGWVVDGPPEGERLSEQKEKGVQRLWSADQNTSKKSSAI